MIINSSNIPEGCSPERERDSSPVVAAVRAAAETSPQAFQVTAGPAGLELAPCGPDAAHPPGRARLKVFSPKPGQTVVFFYKKSLVPYSRDRYSYGGIDLRSSLPGPQDIEAWLEFLSSGFHPERRPPGLRRAFPYEIPD
jgi:hypothetical protein